MKLPPKKEGSSSHALTIPAPDAASTRIRRRPRRRCHLSDVHRLKSSHSQGLEHAERHSDNRKRRVGSTTCASAITMAPTSSPPSSSASSPTCRCRSRCCCGRERRGWLVPAAAAAAQCYVPNDALHQFLHKSLLALSCTDTKHGHRHGHAHARKKSMEIGYTHTHVCNRQGTYIMQHG